MKDKIEYYSPQKLEKMIDCLLQNVCRGECLYDYPDCCSDVKCTIHDILILLEDLNDGFAIKSQREVSESMFIKKGDK